jgi:hypothetical protein
MLRHDGRPVADQPALLIATDRDDEVGPTRQRLLGAPAGANVHRQASA